MSVHPGERLSEWLDSRLEDAESAEVAGHLEECAHCRAEAEDLRALRTLLRSGETPPARETFWAHLEGRIADEQARMQRRRWFNRVLIPGAVAALAAAALALAPAPEAPLDIEGYINEHARYRALHPLADPAAATLVGPDASRRLDEPWGPVEGFGP